MRRAAGHLQVNDPLHLRLEMRFPGSQGIGDRGRDELFLESQGSKGDCSEAELTGRLQEVPPCDLLEMLDFRRRHRDLPFWNPVRGDLFVEACPNVKTF